MHVERIQDVGRFRELRDEWNELLAKSEVDSVFLTWEWLFTWWKHFGRELELALVTVRDGDDLLAIAPLVLRRARVAGPAFEFLGSGTVGSDYLDVIVRHEGRADALAALVRYLDAAQIRLDLTRIRDERTDVIAVAGALSRLGWRTQRIRTDVCPFIPLAGQSWMSYLATLGPEHRANVRRRLRQINTKYAVSFARAESSDDRRAAFAALVKLHFERWRPRGGSQGLGTAALVAFHDEVTEVALERGWLRLFVLGLDRVPVASLYGLRYGRVFSFYQSGFDPVFAKQSVGLITMGLAIEQAIAEGAEEYDFLHGDESYKFLWARAARQLVRLELYPPRLGDRLVGHARRARRAAKRIVKAVIRRAGRQVGRVPPRRRQGATC